MITDEINIRELEEELHSINERLSSFVIETNRMRARVVEIENLIVQSKIALTGNQPVITGELTNVATPMMEVEAESLDISEVDENNIHLPILPKPLEIEGYTSIKDVVCRHLSELVPSSAYSSPYRWYEDKLKAIAVALSLVGKEVVLIKNEDNANVNFEEWKRIIETCRKIATYEKKGDKIGYNKYLAFFCEKYPIPIRQFGDDALKFDFCLQNESVYNDAFQFMYYIDAFKTTIQSDFNRNGFGYYWPNYPNHVIFDKVVINNTLVEFMEMIFMLRYKHNFTIAILPVLDENIIYRPKREAQDETYFSLYYYDDYVEEPTMEIEEKKDVSASTYYSGGSTYVKSHYRSGHWRNGRYVSGGYVRGHYRS